MLHIIQNDPEVPPGTITDYITMPYRVWHPYLDGELPPLTGIKALIVLGGAMGANDDSSYPFLSGLKELIRSVVAAGIPYLGVCLGGQLLAAALGAKVIAGRWEELGTMPVTLTEAGKVDRLFKGIETDFSTFQWHHDSFDLPDGATLLATAKTCRNQAFRVGECAWGLQFHPEVTQQIIRDWCAWEEETAAAVETLVSEFTRAEPDYQATARVLIYNYLQVAFG